ncbi:MAG: hypothetical protein WBD36_14485 [Bacteroidota bacterium]
MPKVILQISYEIDPQKRDEYLSLAKEMKQHFGGERKKNYTVFEVRGKKNSFAEQFVCSSVEEYEALEDDMTESSEKLVERLAVFLKNGKAHYTTLIEAE